jgi:hypothetical protein
LPSSRHSFVFVHGLTTCQYGWVLPMRNNMREDS